ncbi:unnamed protein product [Ambrosiozyma monospora]|uniref:Unnamed protein product n=1 Tax=Ambrosiozyma monospora TaxID=43982 RepID=A0ACB5U335_AMBMO|nr:unnamed protein product [Ambrosiozyma monospora]
MSHDENKFSWSQHWLESTEYNDLKEKLYEIPTFTNDSELQNTHQFGLSNFQQALVVFKRSYNELIRDHSYIISRFLLYIVSGLYLGFSFFKVDHSIFSLQFTMFAIFMVLCVCSPMIHQIQGRCNFDKLLYEMKEFDMFHFSYLPISQMILESILAIVASTISYLCFYFTWSVNTETNRAGLFYLVYAILFQLYYVTFSIGLLYISPNLLLCNVMDALLFSFLVVFCGAMQPFGLMPTFWKAVFYYESPFTWFLKSLMSILFDKRIVECKDTEYALLLAQNGQTCAQYMKAHIDENGGYLKNPNSFTYCSYCNYRSGEEFLKSLNMRYSELGMNIGIIVTTIVFNVVVGVAGYGLIYQWRFRKGLFARKSTSS